MTIVVDRTDKGFLYIYSNREVYSSDCTFCDIRLTEEERVHKLGKSVTIFSYDLDDFMSQLRKHTKKLASEAR
jgi:hypothetical protein